MADFSTVFKDFKYFYLYFVLKIICIILICCFQEEKQQIKWEFEPSGGQLMPGETASVRVTLTVVDPGSISSTLHVNVDDSRPLAIALFAFASGCGIIIDPSIFPEIDLGFLFRCFILYCLLLYCLYRLFYGPHWTT